MGSPGHADKKKRLERLRARIISEMEVAQWREVWFFPEYEGVLGWQGTQDIMFVGLNPSTGRFPSKADEFFYAQLRKNGFQRAHLTDTIKTRATGGKIKQTSQDAGFMGRQQRYLLEEINIVRPCLIVALGLRAEALLCDWLSNTHKLMRIHHYSYRFGKNSFRRMFAQEIRSVRRKYINNG